MAIRKRGNSYQVYYRHPETHKIVPQSFPTLEEAEKQNALISYWLKYERERFKGDRDCDGKERDKKEARREVIERATLDAVYLEYCESRKDSSPRHIKCQYSIFRPILRILGTMPIKEITPRVIEDLIVSLKETDPSRATTNGRLRVFRAVIYFAQRRGYMPAFSFPKIPGPQYKVFVPPTPEELDAMYAAAPPHIQRVIILGAYCGVRVGQCELFGLTWNDVDLSKRVLRVHGSQKNENAPYREVPIRESLIPIFQQWNEEDKVSGIEHLVHFMGNPVRSIKKAWETMLKAAGIDRRIRPYDLRHAFGTELVAAGIDVGTVAKLMGHSSPAMLLKHYQYVLDRQKIEAVEKLPPLSCMSASSLTYKQQ